MNVSQEVVTVTGGGGSGCGWAIAATFAEHGAAVVVSDINDAGGHETIRLIEQRGGRAHSFTRTLGTSYRPKC